MKKIEVKSSHVAYDKATDTLFIALGEFDPTLLDHEEDISNNMVIQYAWPKREPAFIEAYHFISNHGELPMVITTKELEIHVPTLDETQIFA
jgi:hypothetical protein